MNGQLVIFMLGLFLISSARAEPITDESVEKLLGPVQTVTTVTTIAGKEGERVVSHYDARGNETETLRYVSPDTLTGKSVYTYNSDGKRTETMTYNPDGSLRTKTLYLYNFQGELSEQATVDNVGIIDRARFNPDAKKRTIEETITSAHHEATRRVTHFYDSKGQETATAITARDGSVRKTTLVYDAKGNVTEHTTYTGDGSVLDRMRYTYEFDAVGNWIKQTELICSPATELDVTACASAVITTRVITYAAQK